MRATLWKKSRAGLPNGRLPPSHHDAQADVGWRRRLVRHHHLVIVASGTGDVPSPHTTPAVERRPLRPLVCPPLWAKGMVRLPVEEVTAPAGAPPPATIRSWEVSALAAAPLDCMVTRNRRRWRRRTIRGLWGGGGARSAPCRRLSERTPNKRGAQGFSSSAEWHAASNESRVGRKARRVTDGGRGTDADVVCFERLTATGGPNRVVAVNGGGMARQKARRGGEV